MRTLLILAMVLSLASASAAQDAPPETEPSAFLRILSAVPAGEYVENGSPLVSFGAYHEAITAAGLDIPQGWDDYRISEPGTIDQAVAMAGAFALTEYLNRYGDRYPEVVGFDFFEIEYAASFGVPPQTGIVLAGVFEPDAVIAAHTARGYTVERQDDGGTLLCPPDGCDTGKVVNPAAMDPANPFGGTLGRQEPVFVADGLILNSPDIAVLEAMIAAHEDSADSLADLPEYQALAAAFADTAYTGIDVHAPREADVADEYAGQVQAVLDSAPLPRYPISAVALRYSKIAIGMAVILIYGNETDATQAVPAISARADMPLVRHITDDSIIISYREWYGMLGSDLQPAQVLPGLVDEWSAVVSAMAPVTDPADADFGSAGLYIPLVNLYQVYDVE